MDITFRELKREEGSKADGSTWVAYMLLGTKIEDGSPWTSTKIFDNQYNVELIEQVRQIEKGAKINVLHKKNTAGFWTITGFQPYKEDNMQKKQWGGNKAGGTGGGGKDFKWQGRTGEAYDRSAALYLSFDIMKSCMEPNDMKQVSPEDMAKRLFSLANGLFEYINMGNDQKDNLDPPAV